MVKNKVFVDTGAWIACMSKKDKHHHKAATYIQKLRNNQIPLYTSNYIIDETLTWLAYNDLHEKLFKLWIYGKKLRKINL